jgi:hypothetical protein
MIRPGEAALLYFDTESSKAQPNLRIDMKSQSWVGGRAGLAAIQPRALGFFASFLILLTGFFVRNEPIGVIVILAAFTGALLLVPRLALYIRRRVLSTTVLDFYRRKNVW